VEGLSITPDGWPIRLKWHRLRRRLSDPEFGAEVLAEGFRLGASMEIDLQVRADGGFVVLHDDDLDRETTGTGPVRRHSGADLGRLSLRAQNRPPILSEELAGMIRDAHPGALLQFDMKNDLTEVGAAGVAHLAALFGNVSDTLIVSGASEPLIAALAGAMPGLKKGLDPTDELLALWSAEGLAGVEKRLRQCCRHPLDIDMVYLSWEMLVEAAALGLDMVALAHAEGVAVDAWTHEMASPETGFTDSEWTRFSALTRLKPDQITTDSPIATEAAVMARTRG
jgi:glycerophosphoryl diester phosphodiesterase